MNIDKILNEMTLEEKASLCSGEGFWHTKEIKRLDIQKLMVADGPHGLRKVNEERDCVTDESIKAVCFPTASALACSFDRDLIEKLGKALGDECQAEGVAVLLGPGANIKRSPLCGRNFEYFSEDPYLSTEMATAYIKGVQSRGVGTSLKHFALNNQEHRRMSTSAEVDERTMREIYLASFEGAVKNAKPWTVMCSYNRVNGVHVSENPKLLSDILCDEWGYKGLVVSDWGAVDNRVNGVRAGLDLEMPSSMGKNDRFIVEAVRLGKLDIKYVDKCVRRILELLDKYEDGKKSEVIWDKESDHKLAAKIESECMVLLKNEDNILPLDKKKKIAFIGKFAECPRYQGGGSSHINSYKVTSALEAVKGVCQVKYAEGYLINEDIIDEKLLSEAVQTARDCEIAVLFVGLPDFFESEGYDRKHLRLPECQLELIKRIREVNENIVVVLHNGSAVEMPFVDDVKGILEAYLGGQAVGKAEVDILFGKKNPCGKLAETFPRKLSDNPSYLNFPGEGDRVRYQEGIFVGYRYYDKKEIEPLFPFGYGLSYTTFEYKDIYVSKSEINDDEELIVTVNVKNTGKVRGKEIVQLYVNDEQSSVIRPIKELKGFEKVTLVPGEEKKVVFILDKRSFAYYNTDISDWYTEYGKYNIFVGSSSRDIRLKASVYVAPTNKIRVEYTLNSTGGDVMSTETGKELFKEFLKDINAGINSDSDTSKSDEQMALAMYNELPLRAMVSFSDNENLTREKLNQLVRKLNIVLNSNLF